MFATPPDGMTPARNVPRTPCLSCLRFFGRHCVAHRGLITPGESGTCDHFAQDLRRWRWRHRAASPSVARLAQQYLRRSPRRRQARDRAGGCPGPHRPSRSPSPAIERNLRRWFRSSTKMSPWPVVRTLRRLGADRKRIGHRARGQQHEPYRSLAVPAGPASSRPRRNDPPPRLPVRNRDRLADTAGPCEVEAHRGQRAIKRSGTVRLRPQVLSRGPGAVSLAPRDVSRRG